ncbi:cytochrome c [Robbsia sp. KACC 23696]|uniref:cytochrome c n=1 Tax=Robbsia sp. KACC 23696 TaxID=3149231 RepID=UPI00325B506E
MTAARHLSDGSDGALPNEESATLHAEYHWIAHQTATVTLQAEGEIDACATPRRSDGDLGDGSGNGEQTDSSEKTYRLSSMRIHAKTSGGEDGAGHDTDDGWHFAHESLVDELRTAPQMPQGDAIHWRGALLDPVTEAGGKALLRALADRLAAPAAWADAIKAARNKGLLLGRGVAYATLGAEVGPVQTADHRADASLPVDIGRNAPSYMAWIVELAVDRRTGAMQLQRVVAGRAEGVLPGANSADPAFQIDGLSESLVTQALQGLLGSPSAQQLDGPGLSVPFDESADSQPWVRTASLGGPATDASIAQYAGSEGALSPALGPRDTTETTFDPAGKSRWQRVAAGLAAAAVANAVFAANGKRERSMPIRLFGPVAGAADGADRDAVLPRGAAPRGDVGTVDDVPASASRVEHVERRDIRRAPLVGGRRRWGGRLAATAGAMVVGALSWQALVTDGAVRMLGPLRPFRNEIPRVAPPAPDTWTAATIERGRRLAAAADCAVCHTAEGAAASTGGRPFDTPFGTVYSTNLTPDVKDGIGGWSYSAFERAMREGISRDGRHLYPVFPYTAFGKMTDADMTALYAFLMTRAPEATPAALATRRTALGFPWGVRPLLAGWNALYLDRQPFAPDPSRSAEWRRGAYLVEALGHCGACHTPRNALGAERGGPGTAAYLSGGLADGWTAPALIGQGDAPQPWTEAALYDYLRVGFSAEHGVAAGPMAPVVRNLATLPAADVRAIAHYVASWHAAGQQTIAPAPDAVSMPRSEVALPAALQPGKRLFDAACAVCHTPQAGVGHFGVRPEMALNSSIQAEKPDNLLRVILAGIDDPASPDLGFMPGFADAYDDAQIAALAGYLRAEHAPDRPAWTDLRAASARVRAALTHEHATQ